ncbi:AraC family ligand binding domain-containing protein [Paenibacillus sp. GXUN7292]|uniref:AraC family ligand binding domain-containing protein n=1 Tax=Paenibacillus sp. GXUN7292 TaxID=3422499 RepID=UPI003D7D9756
MEQVKWKETDVIYYSSRKYLDQNEHCKLYKIDHTWGSIQNHIHDYFQIWFVKKGEFMHAIENQPLYKMVKGNIFLIPPYTMHRVEIEAGGIFEIIGCEFMPEAITEHQPGIESSYNISMLSYLKPFWMEVKQLKPKIPLIGKSDKWAETMLEEMFAEFAAKPPFYNVYLKGCLLQLFPCWVKERLAPCRK